jgi:hypothetical protein
MRKILVLCVLAVTALSACASAAPEVSDGWHLLGQRAVADRAEYDSIGVGADEGDWSAIKLEVRGRAVQFRDMKIHFKNGGVQDVPLRNVIPAGGQSRVIDLVGPDRVISSVQFFYDAQTRRRGRSGGATVYLYGRR